MKKLLFIVLVICIKNVEAQENIYPLWPEGSIPHYVNSNQKEIREEGKILQISNIEVPTFEVFLPAKQNANGQAVLIFPGGGYGMLAYDWEGTDIAKFLNGKGIAGIVVKYRLPTGDTNRAVNHNIPLIDAQRAMRLVRSMAPKFNIRPDEIGVLGFSAGGHLASTLGTQYNREVYDAIDAVDKLTAKPNFMALAYPVIVFGQEATHLGSQENLIGQNADDEVLNQYSTDKQVSKETPPTFLIHATDDLVVPVENSLAFYKALKDHEVLVTMHLYPNGGHGFSLARNNLLLRSWTERLFEWLESVQ